MHILIACAFFALLARSHGFFEGNSAKEAKVKFLLFTKGKKETQVKLGDISALNKGGYVGSRKWTFFLVHGWFGGKTSLTSTFLMRAKDKLLSCHDANVFVVDWGRLAFDPLYFGAARDTRVVGDVVAKMVDWLEKSAGGSKSRTWLVGHSLGGQVVGRAGMKLGGKVSRVTGLDTAEIGFNMRNPSDRLDYLDGKFVDEIHTLVSKVPKGHADFHPNGGANLLPLKIWEHMEAPDMWITSICEPCAYPACSRRQYVLRRCRSIDNNMGFYAKKPNKGRVNYYLKASASNPGC